MYYDAENATCTHTVVARRDFVLLPVRQLRHHFVIISLFPSLFRVSELHHPSRAM